MLLLHYIKLKKTKSEFSIILATAYIATVQSIPSFFPSHHMKSYNFLSTAPMQNLYLVTKKLQNHLPKCEKSHKEENQKKTRQKKF